MQKTFSGSWKKHSLVSIIAMVMATLVVTGAQFRVRGKEDRGALTGTWRSTFNIKGQPPGKALETFVSDGTLVETDTGSVAPPPGIVRFRSPSRGVWVRAGDREFDDTFERFLFDEQGNFIGTSKIQERITLNETLDEFDAVFKFTRFDPSGNPVVSGSGTAHATRMRVEPLDSDDSGSDEDEK